MGHTICARALRFHLKNALGFEKVGGFGGRVEIGLTTKNLASKHLPKGENAASERMLRLLRDRAEDLNNWLGKPATYSIVVDPRRKIIMRFKPAKKAGRIGCKTS